MSAPVACGHCHADLDEPSDLPVGERSPCPHCGSTTRAFAVSGSGSIILGGSVSYAVVTQANLLLQAVITLGEKTSEGRIIESVAPAWLEIARLMQGDPSIIYQIDARKWEEIIAGAYERAGFDEVILTPRSGDHGRDVIAVKRGLWTIRVIDQVKAYGHGHLVPANDVRALIGVLVTDQAATKGLVTTTSDFAPKIWEDPSIKPYLPYRLELVNGTELVRRLDLLSKT